MLTIEPGGAPGIEVRKFSTAPGSWNAALARVDDAALAHAAEWQRAIATAYGHEPLYLMAGEGDDGALLPAFIVRRPLAGAIVTSMPFLDGGGPCGGSAACRGALVARLIDEARAIGARAVELRSDTRLPVAVAPSELKVNMSLALPADPDDLWSRLDKTVRNQIRKAERSGLTIESGGAEHLPAFYEAYVERMRDLGSPPHALAFLAAVVAAFEGRARVILARRGRLTVGGLIAVPFKDRLVVPWAACFARYFPWCPNMLLYWAALRLACADRCRSFEFGRSTRGSGTFRFKQQWGAEPRPLFWYTIPLSAGRRRGARERGSPPSTLARVWRRLPLGVTRQLGPRVRRYLVQ